MQYIYSFRYALSFFILNKPLTVCSITFPYATDCASCATMQFLQVQKVYFDLKSETENNGMKCCEHSSIARICLTEGHVECSVIASLVVGPTVGGSSPLKN